MIKTAIILAGGLGTRLRTVVADLPKCMAPVSGIPFINFIITYLKKEGIENFIFSLGYKSEAVINYINKEFPELQKKYVVEDEQLGTGGAIKAACNFVTETNVVVVNGDTLFNVNLPMLSKFHIAQKAHCTIALKEMENFDRYGVVETGENYEIKAFNEKQYRSNGCINGGVYILEIAEVLMDNYPEVFSFEKEYLEKNTGIKDLYGIVNNNYFIDIGIPQDYQLFQDDFKNISKKNNFSAATNHIEQFLKELK